MIPGLLAAIAVFSYLLGGLNGAIIASKYVFHRDVRDYGSGNAGLTNFFRTFGGPLTFVVILCDVLKAVVALLVSQWLMFSGYTIFISAASTTAFWDTFAKYWAGLFCLLGHMFPCMFQFKGGKGSGRKSTGDRNSRLRLWRCIPVMDKVGGACSPLAGEF